MAKSKKRKRRSPRTAHPKKQLMGFDYGCLPYTMAVGSFDFPGHLRAASIDGVAYGDAWSEVVHQTIPTISLVGQNGGELAKAFETFNEWSKLTDPDSVELTFVFRSNGSYVLAISAEPSRLERRCLGFSRVHKPLAFVMTWFKPIDSTHPLLLSFRKYSASPIAPFLFAGVVYDPRKALSASSPPDVRFIPNLRPLLKFDVTFVDEADVMPNTIGWAALMMDSLPTSPKGSPKPEPEDVKQQRVRTLRYHFPVTLERFRRSPNVSQLMQQLACDGVRAWQVEQALCNLVLSVDMGRGPHYVGLNARKVEKLILNALHSRYELANGIETPNLSTEMVRTQVVADGNALLRHFGKQGVDNPAALQAALQSLSLLESPLAVTGHTAQ